MDKRALNTNLHYLSCQKPTTYDWSYITDAMCIPLFLADVTECKFVGLYRASVHECRCFKYMYSLLWSQLNFDKTSVNFISFTSISSTEPQCKIDTHQISARIYTAELPIFTNRIV